MATTTPFVLRFRFQGKQTSTNASAGGTAVVNAGTTYRQLQEFVTREDGGIAFGVDPGSIRFKSGFPPKVVTLAPAEPIGHNNTIRNKDMLHVEVVDSKGKRVYYYVVQPFAPFTIGCFGPPKAKTKAKQMAECRLGHFAFQRSNNF